jgi:GNAT superfamily N-acetyltransferase
VTEASIRPATEADLDEICDIWYRDDVAADPDPPANTAGGALFAHNVRSGEFHVAEGADGLVGFSGSIVRGSVRFLTDLFVRPDHQDRGLGGELLARAMPNDGLIHATLASRDLRAQSLYVRSGMRPLFPHVELEAPRERVDVPASDAEVVEADPSDPALVAMDAEIGGRPRPQDHRDWIESAAGVPVWFDRAGRRVGYGYIRMKSQAFLRHPDWATVGPVGARSSEDARTCVLSAVRWAVERAAGVMLGVPGPHPALEPLLEAGLRITYVELFMSSDPEPFADPRRYVPAGSGEF